MGERVRVIRPEIGPLLPTFVLDRYEGVEARLVGDFSDDELARYLDLNMTALADQLEREPADLVSQTTRSWAARSPKRAARRRERGTPSTCTARSWSTRSAATTGWPGSPAGRWTRRTARSPGRSTSSTWHASCWARASTWPAPRSRRPGVDVDAFRPEAARSAGCSSCCGDDRPGAHAERHPDADAADRLEGVGPFVLYFGKLLRQKGVHLLLEAWQGLAARHPHVTLVVVGFGSDREWLESQAGERVVFTGAMDHPQLQALIPCAELVVVPSVLPEAFGMVAAEAASCGVMTVVSDHSGLAEVAAGLGDAARTFDGAATTWNA